MTTKDSDYGIFEQNELLIDCSKKQTQRTALLGQIVRISARLGGGNVAVQFLKEEETVEAEQFYCPQQHILNIDGKLFPFIASITSPQERVKLVKNRELCEKLKRLTKDQVVGFTGTKDVLLGKIQYIGNVDGIGKCYGIELHEKRPNSKGDGSYRGINYFRCLPGYGLFTTIEKIRPLPYIKDPPNSLPPLQPTIDDYVQRNISDIIENGKIKNENIVTKYQEYIPNKTTPNYSYLRHSLSLQSLDIDSVTNTNNDFDQNTIIQPDKSHLIDDPTKKYKVNKSEVDLIEVIGGSWSGSCDQKELDTFANIRRNFDKNENIKEKTSVATNVKARIKSMNPLDHLMDSSSNRRAKFYTGDDFVEKNGYKDEKNKKINEKNEQLAQQQQQQHQKSTFYVVNNDKPKYHDPEPGTTNDITIGSLVEVMNDVIEEPFYGVVRWMGVENGNNKFIQVGVELEEELIHLPLILTDGTWNGERYFKCADNRALFVPLQQCHKDSRFQDGVAAMADLVKNKPENQPDCKSIPGAVAPLCMPTEEDVEAVCGKFRGIQGHHNSCYLDVTLFSMFTYTAVFDSVLFRPKNSTDLPDYEEVQRVLREEIVNPLRTNLFVDAENVMKLRELLDRLSSVSGLTSEEKDPEEFLNSLLAQILKAEPFLKLNSGQESFHYQLFVDKIANLTLPTVQQLFEQSFLTSNVKLKEVPSCLIIQMPRFGKSYKMYPRILPSQLLDVTDIIEGSPRQCFVCGKLARYECNECFDNSNNAGLENTAFCRDCLTTAHKNEKRQHHRPTKLDVPHDFSIMEDHCQPPRLFMELFAVICIETSHYVAFVKCGVGHEAPWCFFDSMADRQGEKNGFNIPEMVACPDVSRWLSDDQLCRQLHENCPNDRLLPEHARRLLCDAYICMYQSSDVMMYR